MRFRPVWVLLPAGTLLASCGLILDFDIPPSADAGLVFDGSSDSDSGFMLRDAQSEDGDLPDAHVVADADSYADADADADGMDAGFVDGCEDELGLCLEVTEFSSDRETLHWRHNVVWTLPGGALLDTEWAPGVCIGGLRHGREGQTQCLLAIPDPGMETVGSPIVYAYPVMDDMMPWCTDTGCPGFPGAYRVWHDMVEIPVDPGLGLATAERRPDTPHGTRFCLRITL
jgi:hypothetical protein